MFVSWFSVPDLPLKSSLGDSVNGELGPCNSDIMRRIPHLTGLEVIDVKNIETGKWIRKIRKQSKLSKQEHDRTCFCLNMLLYVSGSWWSWMNHWKLVKSELPGYLWFVTQSDVLLSVSPCVTQPALMFFSTLNSGGMNWIILVPSSFVSISECLINLDPTIYYWIQSTCCISLPSHSLLLVQQKTILNFQREAVSESQRLSRDSYDMKLIWYRCCVYWAVQHFILAFDFILLEGFQGYVRWGNQVLPRWDSVAGFSWWLLQCMLALIVKIVKCYQPRNAQGSFW